MKWLLILMFTTPLTAGWRFATHDRWDTKSGAIIKYDKLEHFVCATGLTLVHKNAWKWVAVGSILWEVKDALFPFEKYGLKGGDGFSYRDLIADFAGIACGLLIRKVAISIYPNGIALKIHL